MNPNRIHASGGAMSVSPDGLISLSLYTGAPIFVEGWYDPKTKRPTATVIDLDGLQLPTGRTPILLGHDTDRRIGWADPQQVQIVDGTVRVTGATRIPGPDSEKLAADAAAGFPFQASIGADPLESEFIPAGSSAPVNGRVVAGPVWIVRKSLYTEGSVVVFGADNATAAMVASKQEQAMPEGTPTKVKAASVDIAALKSLMDAHPGKEAMILSALESGKSIEEVTSALELVSQAEGEMATQTEAKDATIAAPKAEIAKLKAEAETARRIEAERGAKPAPVQASATAAPAGKTDAERWPHLTAAMREGRVAGKGNFNLIKV